VSGVDATLTTRQFLGGLLGACSLGAVANAQAGQGEQQGGEDEALTKLSYPRTFVLVRHAEKAAEPPQDPALTEAGQARANRLAEMLRASRVTHAFVTEFARTQATLTPLCLIAKLAPTVVGARDGKALLSALESLPRGSLAVVAGHSNTVPALFERLTGGQQKVEIAESEYDRLFLVVQWGPKRASLGLELRF